jgi:hypothetical protein
MAGLILPVVAENSQEIGLYIRRLNSANPTTVLVPFKTMRACRRGPRVAGLIGSCVSLAVQEDAATRPLSLALTQFGKPHSAVEPSPLFWTKPLYFSLNRTLARF